MIIGLNAMERKGIKLYQLNTALINNQKLLIKMGWITDRKMRTGHGLALGHKVSARMKSPLRKIVEVIQVGDNNLFGSGDKVKLECGHEVFSKGSFSARCRQCAALEKSNNPEDLSKID